MAKAKPRKGIMTHWKSCSGMFSEDGLLELHGTTQVEDDNSTWTIFQMVED